MDFPTIDPNERIKRLAHFSDTLDIDPNVPPRRYYRSGLEMVRMANVYLNEGSLENAYVLYMKFMTLFLEKIRKHPDYNSVNANIKATTSEKIKEVLPIAEKLKSRLLEQYSKEYNVYLERKSKEKQSAQEQERLRKLEQKKQDIVKPKLPTNVAHKNSFPNIVQPISIDSVQYPDPTVASVNAISDPDSNIPKKLELLLPPPDTSSAPSFDRNAKPSSLLSPTVSSKSTALRPVVIPSRISSNFLNLAYKNTVNNIETCAILAGKLEKNQLIITHMILPKQKGTPDSCVTMNEEELFDFQDQHNLITLGWIHTHPTQTAFLSSVDLHTHCSYQMMMPEAVAIVCAPKYDQMAILTLTPNYGLDFISNCRQSGFHPHPAEPPLFKEADHVRIENSAVVEVVDLRN